MNQNKSSGGGKGDGNGGGKQKKLDRIENRKIKGLGLNKSYLNYESSKPQYFVSSYDLKAKKFNTSSVYQNTFENIKSYKIENHINSLNTQIIFNRNNEYWFGHLNPETKKLDLIKID